MKVGSGPLNDGNFIPLAILSVSGQVFARQSQRAFFLSEESPAAEAAPAPGSLTWLLERSDVRLGLWAQMAAAAGVVLVGTVLAMLLYQLFDLTRLAIFFLGSVIVCALLFGRRPGVFAAFLAFGAYNFSLVEPRFTVRFAGPDDVLTLIAFLVVALLIGGLAGRVRESERDSRKRADQTEVLLEASRAFGDAVGADAVSTELHRRLSSVVSGPTAVLRSAGEDAPSSEAREAAETAARFGTASRRDGWRARRLFREPGSPIAVWRSDAVSPVEAAGQDRLATLMIDLASAAVNRIRLVDIRTGLEADARAGRLRDAILSSISHDLRTPLATVLASASSLQEYGDRFDLRTRDELAGVIVHEADRLNRYVERLLDLSRIEAGQVAPRLEPLSLTEVVDAALRRLPARAEEAVRADDLDAAPMVMADARLLEQVVYNLLDNALVHGGEGVRIDLTAAHENGRVGLTVRDDGPGVPADELDLLCDKFRRGRDRSPDAPGTGIGLAVVKGFVEAMGGDLSLTGGDAGRGLKVHIALNPAEAA
jgi:two-component system, OmpR family, sensor histidine kinase KdpD